MKISSRTLIPSEIVDMITNYYPFNDYYRTKFEPSTNTLIITGCVEIPVHPSCCRVIADDENVLGYLEKISYRYGPKIIGWYHSHSSGYGSRHTENRPSCCCKSCIQTQTMWQCQYPQFIGIVLDPFKTVRDKKLDITAFRSLPRLKHTKFYSLKISYFIHPLVM